MWRTFTLKIRYIHISGEGVAVGAESAASAAKRGAGKSAVSFFDVPVCLLPT